MKTQIISIAIILFFAININAQIKITSDGKIGLGTSTPQTPLDIKVGTYSGTNIGVRFSTMYDNVRIDPLSTYKGELGSIYPFSVLKAYTLYFANTGSLSDERLKENIVNISNGLNVIKQIRPVKYDIKSEFVNKNKNLSQDEISKMRLKDHYGVIAQELKEILPSLVTYDSTFQSYAVNYIDMIPILISAVKEQQGMIEDLKKKLDSSGDLKNATFTSSTDDQVGSSMLQAILFQNTPNPFNQNTTINYYIPESAGLSAIYIYNMQGYQVKSIPLSAKGNGSIEINASEFRAGMYFYALIVDGKEIDTKKMILTE